MIIIILDDFIQNKVIRKLVYELTCLINNILLLSELLSKASINNNCYLKNLTLHFLIKFLCFQIPLNHFCYFLKTSV